MRIGIDARELSGRPTGVGRYLDGLLREWAAPGGRGADDHFVLYFSDAGPLPELPGGNCFSPTRLSRWPEFIPGRETLWQQITLARRLRRDPLDVFFGPAYSLPLRGHTPAVVTVHDLSFEAHPEWFPRRQAARRRQICRRSCSAAALVLTDSAFSRDELHKRYALPEGRIQVVPLAADGRFRPLDDPAAAARLKQRYGFRGPVVLSPGSILNRRRIPLLLEAFAMVLRSEPELTLVFAGENRSWPRIDLFQLARSLNIDDRVAAPGYVADEDLVLLYNQAALTVYLSEYEGFGLPPLEALCCGCPVIVSAGGALEENFSRIAEIHEGLEPESLAQRMLDRIRRSLEESWPTREQRSVAARRGFSRERTASRTLELIRGVAARTVPPAAAGG